MTNEYKDNLLRYLTANAKNETGDNKPYFRNLQTTNNNLMDILQEQFTYYEIIGQCNSEKSDNIFIYGNYRVPPDEDYNYGFIVILGKNYEILNIISEYNTGTKFYAFNSLNVDNETGNIYGIDKAPNQYRFILLNNFLNSDTVVLRQSYLVPNQYNNFVFLHNSVKKAIGESTYFLVGNYLPSGSTTYRIGLIIFTIVVGGENTWEFYTNTSGARYLDRFDYVTNKVNDKFTVTIVHIQEPGFYKFYFNGETVTDTFITNTNTTQIQVLSDNIFYYTNFDADTNLKMQIMEYNNGTIRMIAEREFEGLSVNMYLKLINGNITTISLLNKSLNYDYEVYLGIYNGNDYVDTLVYETEDDHFYIDGSNLYVYNNFNLYKICCQLQNDAYIGNVVITRNYDGLSFNDKNSLNPSSVELFNENEEIIYARNLYNKYVSNNTTQATVEIPNTFLNDETIQTQHLLSINNNIMIDNSNAIHKNIYETLYLNFFNTLRMINNNDIENPVINNIGASRLNNSISNLIDYDNAKMTKAKINYADNTSEIIPILFSITENAMITNFSISVEKQILNIELISDDENTVYNTIIGNFEIGKSYNIKQKVTVEGLELGFERLYYNGEQVLYNGEEVILI